MLPWGISVSQPRIVGPHRVAPERDVMWGFLIGLYLAMIIYPFLEEWQQRQADKKLLAKMRKCRGTGRRWDVTKGEWIDE